MRGRDQEAYERFERTVELPMLVLALLFVPLLVLPATVQLTPAAEVAIDTATWLIWGAFAAEYLINLYLAPDRRHMVRTHVLDSPAPTTTPHQKTDRNGRHRLSLTRTKEAPVWPSWGEAKRPGCPLA